MKKFLLIATTIALLTGCTRSTSYGQCVGVMEEKESHLKYEVSYWNAFVAFIFLETIIVPIVYVSSDISCPVGVKEVQPAQAAR